MAKKKQKENKKNKGKDGKKNKQQETSSQSSSTQLSGVSVSRSGNTINGSWSASGDTTVVSIVWKKNGAEIPGTYKFDFASNLTHSSVNFNPDEKINNIQLEAFSVDAASWTASQKVYGTYTFKPPKDPTVSYELNSSLANSGTFNWSVEKDDSSVQMFRRHRIETCVVSKWNSSTPPGSGWVLVSNGTTNSGNWKKGESMPVNGNFSASYTRWFRIKSIGPGGESAWKYAHHTYALPREATNVKASATKRNGNAGYICAASWVVPNSFMYPCDSATVMYAKANPQVTTQTANDKFTSTIAYPGSSSPSWTTANSVMDTGGTDALSFVIPELLSDNQMLWLRVDSKHDNHTTYGIPVLVSGITPTLPIPIISSVSLSPTTHRATITLDHNSAVNGSFTAIYYRSGSDPSNYKIVGIFNSNVTSDTIILPDTAGTEECAIGVQSFVADYTPTTASRSEVTNYTITNIKMKSDIVWQEGILPVPPKSVVLTALDTKNVNVKWDWPWKAATNAELSWADREDAWMSTSQPSTYELTNLYEGDWNIAGLDVGTWWVRVRLGRTISGDSNDKINWSLYSDPKDIKLSSAPAIPNIVLSTGSTILDEYVTCYWAYVSTDGTAQLQAEVCEAILTDEVTYELTTDSIIVNSKIYFERTGSGTEQDPYVYTAVEEPVAADLASYYEEIHTNHWAYNDSFAKTQTEQHLSFLPKELGWNVGETHYLAVRVMSASGETSEGWSTPVALTIVNPITCTIDSTSLEEMTFVEEDMLALTADTEIDPNKTYYDSEGNEIANPVEEDLPNYWEVPTRTVQALREFPLSVTVTGAGLGSTTNIIIERSADFHQRRPDDSDLDGYEGEIIVNKTFDNDGTFSIVQDDALGYFDDRAAYRIIVISRDAYGQTAEATLDFEVHWKHQAIVPTANIDLDEDYVIAIITPTVPAGATIGEDDTCDIYRLSIDPPQLIYSGAEFGEAYVDQYPALGFHGGYRIVYKTVNGDYTTELNRIAFYDSTEDENVDILEDESVIVNFKGNQITLPFNVSFSHKWSKDFTETKYLGGSVQGDWNPAVSRTSSVSTTVLDGEEFNIEDVNLLRALAIYPGVCHIRTPEGSSFACNINVSENREEKWNKPLAKISLDITRVDSPGLECVTWAEWLEIKKIRDGEEEEV